MEVNQEKDSILRQQETQGVRDKMRLSDLSYPSSELSDTSSLSISGGSTDSSVEASVSSRVTCTT